MHKPYHLFLAFPVFTVSDLCLGLYQLLNSFSFSMLNYVHQLVVNCFFCHLVLNTSAKSLTTHYIVYYIVRLLFCRAIYTLYSWLKASYNAIQYNDTIGVQMYFLNYERSEQW